GFWYTRMPDPDSLPEGKAQLFRRLFFHPLDGLLIDDERVYGAGRPDTESMYVDQSFDETSAFLSRGTPYVNDDVFALAREDGRSVLRPVFVGIKARSYVDRVGDRYICYTDWKAPKKRLLPAPAAGPLAPEKWTELVPEGSGVLESFAIVKDAL